jgi:hypothetical protein
MSSALCRSILVLFSFLAVLPVAAATEARVSESYGRVPLHFEANRGQAHEDVRFLARGDPDGLYLTASEAVLERGRTQTQDAMRTTRPSSCREAAREVAVNSRSGGCTSAWNSCSRASRGAVA